MRKKIITAITFAIVLCMAFTLVSCGKDKKSQDKETTASTEVTYTNAEGKTQEELNTDEENFYGAWTSHSGYVEDLYGNLDIVINEDKTFDANVTGEKFSGTWKKIDGGISFESVYLSGEMYFGKKCKLVIHEDGVTPITLVHE